MQKLSRIVSNNKRTIIKSTALDLTGKNIDKNVASLLNVGANFVPTPKSVPHMEIITATESQALNLECGKKYTSAENLHQAVSEI